MLGRGGALEVWSVERAQRDLDEYPLQHGKCGELAQAALGCAGELGIPCVELAQDILDRRDAPEARSTEPAQSVLAECPL